MIHDVLLGGTCHSSHSPLPFLSLPLSLLTPFPTNTPQLHIRQILPSPCYSHLAKHVHALLAHREVQRAHQRVRVLHELHLHDRVLRLAHRFDILTKRLLIDQADGIDRLGELPERSSGAKDERVENGGQNDAPKIRLRDDDSLHVRHRGRVFVLVEVEIARDARQDARTGDHHLGAEGRNAVANAVHDCDERLRIDRADRIDVLCEQNLQKHKHGALVLRPLLRVRQTGKRGNREGLERRANHDFEVHFQNVFETRVVVKWKHTEGNVLPL